MSNPPHNQEKFSLTAFRNRKQALNSKNEKFVQAPRRAEKGHLINQLIDLGDEATSPKATIANKAIAAILVIYKNHKTSELYISPGSTWSYEQRFAVLWKAPTFVNEQPSKQEIMSLLINFYPRQLDLISLGYHTIYQYIPRPTEPNRNVYLYFCQYLKKEQFQTLMQYRAKVRVPPQLPNMLQKLKINLSKTIPPPPASIIQKVIQASSCHMPHIVKLWQDYLEARKGGVAAMIDFITLARPHPANPGFPWVSMTKEDGTSWGSLGESNIPLSDAIVSVIERLVRFLNGQLWKDGKRLKMTSSEAYSKGTKLYEHLYHNAYQHFPIDKILTGGKTSGSLVDYLTPHIIFTLSAGNVKPVTAEEIGQGKPDRGIFQSPAMVRIMYMFLSEAINENWKNPSKITNFGWQNGGTEILLNRLFTQVGYEVDHFVEAMDIHPLQPGYSAHEVSFPRCCFWAPDVKAQDNHFHEAYFDITYQVLERDYVSKLPVEYQHLNRAFLGFLHALETKPLVLTNNSVLFSPKHINVSGGPLTSQHSNNASNCIKFEALDFDWGKQFKIAHIANGDDTLFMFHNMSPQDFPLGYIGQLDNYRSEESKQFNTVVQINQEIQTNAQKFEHGAIKKFSKMITDKYNIELKQETLKVYPKLSDCEYLSAKIYFLPEGVFGPPAFIAARPLEKILFSSLWGQTTQSVGVSTDMIAAMRVLASYYDASLVYKDIHIALAKVYEQLKSKESHKRMPSTKYFESDFFEIPKSEFTTLPDLPILPEIFTWMTGLEASSQAPTHSSTEREEFVDYDEEEHVGKSNASLSDEVIYAAPQKEDNTNIEEQEEIFEAYEDDLNELADPEVQIIGNFTTGTTQTTSTTSSTLVTPVKYTAKVNTLSKLQKVIDHAKPFQQWIRDADYFHLLTENKKNSYKVSDTIFIHYEDVKTAGLKYIKTNERTKMGGKLIFTILPSG